MLEELEECGFIRKYTPFGKKKNGMIFQLIDSLSLFHINFLSHLGRDIRPEMVLSSPSFMSWCGLAYEKVILNHMRKVKEAMGISGISTEMYTWRSDPGKLREGEHGAQIDIVIDRADGVISLVEVKWSSDGSPFTITGETEKELLNKKQVFMEQTGTRKTVFIAMFTLTGLVRNAYSDCVQSFLTLDDLF